VDPDELAERAAAALRAQWADDIDISIDDSTLVFRSNGVPEEPTDLDACLGHTGPTPDFDGDTYHYHVISTANYITDCYTGTVG